MARYWSSMGFVVAGEELRMTDWESTLALTASQKRVGVAAAWHGGGWTRAIQAFKGRKTPVPTIMPVGITGCPSWKLTKRHEGGLFSLQPAVNLVTRSIPAWPDPGGGHGSTIARHLKIGQRAKPGWRRSRVRSNYRSKPEYAAHTLSAPRYPQGVMARIPAAANRQGVILAGGLHPACKAEYFGLGTWGPAPAATCWQRWAR